MCLGTLLGMGRLAQARYNPLKGFLQYCVRWPITVYVSFFRGTPLFVQIFLMYFAVLPVFIHPVDGLLISGQLARDIRSNYGAMLAGVCAITLNSGAYMCEIFRAGIQSLDKGQMEAARSLGMSYMQAMRTIILPQAFRGSVAPLGNTLIALLKNSTVAAAASVATETSSLMSEMIEFRPDVIIQIFLIFALGYVILIIPIGMLTTYLSNKLAVRR